ncbi:MAG: hypothetical protein BWY31_02600 [Lentisphaerae bacterium ADurb.Bin242]|nr:MAG: hypothetical protein BWY31_02600 [Lentisphaerae bacterium ADurb.Bin242]
MKDFFCISVLLVLGALLSASQPLEASDLFSFIPRNSACTLFLDLAEQNRRMPAVQERLEAFLESQDKELLKKNNLKIRDICSALVISMPSLAESDGYVIVKTGLPEKRFRELLRENTVPDVTSRTGKFNDREFYEISFRSVRVSGGKTKVKIRTFALMYLAPDIVVLAKDSVAPYFREPRGLAQNMLKLVKVPGAFASGYAVADDSFLADNPFLPPSRLNSFSASFGVREDIVLKSEFRTASPQDANRTMLLLQQYLCLAGLFLNNENPVLMQELANSFKVQCSGLNVTMNGSLSKEFFVLLGNSASTIQSRLEQPAAAPGVQTRTQP